MKKCLLFSGLERGLKSYKHFRNLALVILAFVMSLSFVERAIALTLGFSTYLGTSGEDYGYSIDVNENGETFVTGNTNSNSFPITSGSYDTSHNGNYDVYLTKISANGSSLIFSTFIGGSGADYGRGVKLDQNDNSYFAGYTESTNFPTQNAFDPSHNGGTWDIFITKISPNGNSLSYSTFIGGSSSDLCWAFTVDTSGNAYVTGQTSSSNFPTLNAFDSSFNGGATSADAFLTKLSSSGSSLVYSTFLGGSSGQEAGFGVFVNSNGNAFVSGRTDSNNFPTQNAYDSSHNGLFDIFITQFSQNGTTLVYSTYFGGSNDDYSLDIKVSQNGSAFITGYTDSGNFPIVNAYDPTHNGSNDAFLTAFNWNGSLAISTFLGSSGLDRGIEISFDESENIFITGHTTSNNFPTLNAFDPTHNGSNDLFITQFDSSATSLIFSTYFGGSGTDFQSSNGNPCVYKNKSLYLTAYIYSSDFPTTNGAFDQSYNGLTDAAIVKFQFTTGNLFPNSLVSSANTNPSQNYTPQVQISNLDSSLTSTATTATMEISFNGNQIYTDTQTVPEIAPVSDSTVTFTSLIPYKSGTYEVMVYTELSGDSDTSNDTLWTSFEVLGDVAINEFLPFGNSQFDPTFTEFFEIANTSSQSIDISNWTIENSSAQTITVSNGTTIPANDYFVFTKYSNALNGGIPFDYSFNPSIFILDDTSDFLVLKDSNGTVVDSVFYDASWNVAQGESFERKNVQLNSSNVGSWCKGTTVFGTENNKGTPGSASSCLENLADCLVNPSSLDFGNVDFLTNSMLSAKIFSTGDGDLTIDSLIFNSTEFTTNLTTQTISSGDSVEFQITYSPTTEGIFDDTLTIFTNDWNDLVCQIAVTGNGVDVVAPNQISDFSLISYNGTSAKLRFTATGDDFSNGTASSYEIRQSTNEITDVNFSSATLVSNIPTPSASGILDSVTVSGLSSGSQYYFGIKAIDNVGNESPLSTATSFDRAEITSITDVQNDNGGNVRINFNANYNDYTFGTGLNTNQYAILRKFNPNYSPSGKGNSQIFETLPSGTWEQVGTVTAAGEQSYSTVVPTLADSNSTGVHEFEFLVRAVSIVSPTYNSVSNVVLAHSVDNLPPTIPPNQNFTNNGNGTTSATWSSVYDSDLANYSLWAELAPEDFVFQQLVTPTSSATQNLTFNNVSGAISYAIGSVDLNGNESLPFANRISSLEIEIIGNDVVLSWIGKISATVYKVYRSQNADLSNSTQIGTYIPNGIEPSFTDFGVAKNVEKYFYFVTWED